MTELRLKPKLTGSITRLLYEAGARCRLLHIAPSDVHSVLRNLLKNNEYLDTKCTSLKDIRRLNGHPQKFRSIQRIEKSLLSVKEIIVLFFSFWHTQISEILTSISIKITVYLGVSQSKMR